MINIKETIVVEGKDDVSAVLAAVEANVVCTHGYGISRNSLDLIRAAYEGPGIIIFTDPDHAGLSIREKLSSLFPNAKHAYLTQTQAEKNGDIGIENAGPEDIIKALESASAEKLKLSDLMNMDDMFELGLAGNPDSAKNRERLGAALGIGYANTKTFLKRLNYFGITKERIINDSVDH